MNAFFPTELTTGHIKRYIEPFVGGGAVFFFISQNFPVEELFIFDINPELILAYTAIQQNVARLIHTLNHLEVSYLSLSEENRKDLFYQVRMQFNNAHKEFRFDTYNDQWIQRTAEIIFLNRTCFNGLFRVNSKGEFNVPFGKYKNPRICDAENLQAVAQLLQKTHICRGDFESCETIVNNQTFVYFDPPYRPISQTANFTSYSRDGFGDQEQLRLAKFYRKLDTRHAKLMLSNSDPKNEDPGDNFFEDAYRGFRIERVKASRNINSNANGRGIIDELLILNY
jgi:DNA adenine methylase